MTSQTSGSKDWGHDMFFKFFNTLEWNSADKTEEGCSLPQKYLYLFLLPVCSTWLCGRMGREGEEKMGKKGEEGVKKGQFEIPHCLLSTRATLMWHPNSGSLMRHKQEFFMRPSGISPLASSTIWDLKSGLNPLAPGTALHFVLNGPPLSQLHLGEFRLADSSLINFPSDHLTQRKHLHLCQAK